MAIGKMAKHKVMKQHSLLQHYLPETYWLTPKRIFQILSFYPTIFIKPNHGSGGTGIIRVKRIKDIYEVRCGQKNKRVPMRSLYKAIQYYQNPSHKYLVQRGLELAKFNGSIVDIRIYMQKPYSQWIISGMITRVAAPNQYVTNYHKGGHAEPLDKVLASIFKNNTIGVNNCLNTIKNLSSGIAQTLNRQYPNIRELGIDLGIEKTGRLWIIEANSQPGHKLFTKLPDKTMLFTIRKNKRLIKQLYY